MDERRQYWAFISYRHLDNHEPGREWATWIARELETYEVPPELVGTTGARGDIIPSRIYPVFRDEDELSADDDLAGPIREALELSKVLVVICSPRAVTSRYVGNEIEHYKSLGRSDRVLAMMIDGEPHDPERECFPEALKHPVDPAGRLDRSVDVEPVAADFRFIDGSQGWTSLSACRRHLADRAAVAQYRERCELGKLKLVSGILGVPLGVLSEREKAYQLARAKARARIFTAVAAAMGALALLAVAGGVYASIKADEAERERDRARRSEQVALNARSTAEELIGAMLFELGDKLEPIGRLDLLGDVSVSAEHYFDNLPPDQIDAESERNRGVMLDSRARVVKAGGDLNGALAYFEEALGIVRGLLAADPDNPTLAQDLVISLKNVGDILRDQNRIPEAEEKYREAASALQALAGRVFGDGGAGRIVPALLGREGAAAEAEVRTLLSENPGVVEMMGTSAVLMERLGDAAFARGDYESAGEHFGSAVSIQEALARYDPASRATQASLAAAYDSLAQLAFQQQDYETAASRYRQMVELARTHLGFDPADVVWQESLAHGLGRLGVIASFRKDTGGYRKFATEALEYYREIAGNDPGNRTRQRNLYVGLTQAALAERANGDSARATALFDEAGRIAEALVAADGTNALWRGDLAGHLTQRASAQRGMGDHAAALATDLRIIGQYESLLQGDPGNLALRRSLLLATNWAAIDCWSMGKLEAAAGYYTRSAGIAESIVADLPQPTRQSREDLAGVWFHLGQVEFERERLKEAEDWFRKSVELHESIVTKFEDAPPQCVMNQRDGFIGLGRIELSREQWDLAAEHFRRAATICEGMVARSPDSVPGWKCLSELYVTLGQVAQQAGRLPEAVDWSTKALATATEARQLGLAWEGLTEEVLQKAGKNLEELKARGR